MAQRKEMIEQSANGSSWSGRAGFYPEFGDGAGQYLPAGGSGRFSFQCRGPSPDEFDDAVKTLSAAGVTVHVYADTPTPAKPDAVFPNNWFSTHHDERIALYPMYSHSPPPRPHRQRRCRSLTSRTLSNPSSRCRSRRAEYAKSRTANGFRQVISVNQLAAGRIGRINRKRTAVRQCVTYGPLLYRWGNIGGGVPPGGGRSTVEI
ncbi:MAG: arginine deiminase-related protein [Chthoniobacterales bacterium]